MQYLAPCLWKRKQFTANLCYCATSNWNPKFFTCLQYVTLNLSKLNALLKSKVNSLSTGFMNNAFIYVRFIVELFGGHPLCTSNVDFQEGWPQPHYYNHVWIVRFTKISKSIYIFPTYIVSLHQFHVDIIKSDIIVILNLRPQIQMISKLCHQMLFIIQALCALQKYQNPSSNVYHHKLLL